MSIRPCRTARARRSAVVALTVLALAAPLACASGTDASTAGSVPATGRSSVADGSSSTTGTDAPTTTSTSTTSTSTSTSTTTTTTAPTTTAPPTTVLVAPVATTTPAPKRPNRAPPPKAGRPAPPGSIPLPSPAVVEYEGDWTPAGPDVNGAPAMYTTVLRTNATGSSTAGIAWIDTTAVKGQLFPGTTQPGGQWSVPFNIPIDQKPSLLAAFNSGFLLNEAQGGFYLEGREAVPLRNGTAALSIDTNGVMNVGMLGRDVNVGPDIAAIRQNLPLLIDGGVINGSATDRDNSVWGATLGGGAYVWRSGVGVRGDGTLVYVGGPAMSARMLASTLVAAGAVRAMELDINPNWVTFNIFSCDGAGQCNGRKLLPGMLRDPNRYLTPENRDFFAIFAR
jgi:hypothetical protein